MDEIEICQNIEPHEEENSVKSKAVVKLSTVQLPARFARLQCNTDLNLPPSNWLSNSANTYGLQQAIYHSSGFASFRMANMFPDCLGEVDVVSDAENIKNLLKLPYSPKSAISMMVHRIENTLLIDEFDIQKYLLRKADDDWEWLRTFICEHILSSLNEKDRNVCLKDKSRGTLQRKNLLSKFLYHSLQQSKESQSTPENVISSNQNEENDEKNRTLPLTGPLLPEPDVEENVPDPHTNHVFNRNVVWTFEDIRMLIGTDMPIFGGGTRPCISLRLRDMTKPINVLTGIDYWLDNLMCNVPEVVMCYHLDGIVQKYELIKTEDLPYLEDSKFSPQLIRNVAQNILAFLKANATKAGHTYWLFKGKNDDVVKLYDLTTLCRTEDCDSTKNENPFTVPVAMLLYTVARNMKNSAEKISAKKAGSIRTLLVNCIKLLPKEKYPKIVTSSYYILSDLHIPAGIDPKSPDFDGSNSDLNSSDDDVYDLSECDDSELDDDEDTNLVDNINDNVAIKNICDTLKEFKLEDNWKNNRLPPPLIGLVEERCRIALQHVYDGLDCLKYFSSNEEEMAKEKEKIDREANQKKIIHEEQHPNMAKPFQPIPLPYESLKEEPKLSDPGTAIPMCWKGVESKLNKKTISKKIKNKESPKKIRPCSETSESSNEEQKLIVNEQQSTMFKSWNVHLKLLLVEKACLCYATLAEHFYTLENYGKCVQHIYMALRCQQIVASYMTTMNAYRSCLLGRAGDCFFNISKSWDKIDGFLEQYQSYVDLDNGILIELQKEIENQSIPIDFPEPTRNIEDLLLKSCKCYEFALKYVEDNSRSNLVLRLGSVRNELGIKYMNWSHDEYTMYIENDENNESTEKEFPENDLNTKEPLYQSLAKLSYDNLIKGITAFQEVGDKMNLAFLLCNLGRFMRYRAHIHFVGETPNSILVQKKYYTEAFGAYERALRQVGSKRNQTDLWDLINWELSTATFTYAKQIQDYGQCVNITEGEIADILQKSLKFCDVDVPSPRQILYKFRSGLIHHRLASLYHSYLRRSTDETKRKTCIQLSHIHYDKASKIFMNLREIKPFFEVQLEGIGLEESLAEGATGPKKIKNLETALELCLQTKPILDHISVSGFENSSTEDMEKLLKLFKSRIQFILRTLAKHNLAKSIGKEPNKIGNLYKLMYSCTLTINETEDTKQFAENIKLAIDKLLKLINDTDL